MSWLSVLYGHVPMQKFNAKSVENYTKSELKTLRSLCIGMRNYTAHNVVESQVF